MTDYMRANVGRGMWFLDRTEPRWQSRTIYILSHAPQDSMLSFVVAQGGLVQAALLRTSYGMNWMLIHGLWADPKGEYGMPINPLELDALWRRMMIARSGL